MDGQKAQLNTGRWLCDNDVNELLIKSVIFGNSGNRETHIRKSNYNTVHNILEFYKALVQAPFTTSKAKLDIFRKKLYIWVASWAAKRIKT